MAGLISIAGCVIWIILIIVDVQITNRYKKISLKTDKLLVQINETHAETKTLYDEINKSIEELRNE